MPHSKRTAGQPAQKDRESTSAPRDESVRRPREDDPEAPGHAGPASARDEDALEGDDNEEDDDAFEDEESEDQEDEE